MSAFLRPFSSPLRLAVLAFSLLGCSIAWAAAPAAHSRDLPVGLAPALDQTLLARSPAVWQAKSVQGGAAFSNPVQRLRMRLDGDGLHLIMPGEAPITLRLIGYSQGPARAALRTRRPMIHGARVSRDLGAGLSEWYENGPLGIEQGFMLVHPLDTSGSVALSFTLQGPLKASLMEDGLAFQDQHGRPVLDYGGFLAYDANHRALPARMQLTGDRLSLNVDARGARYPVTLDPLFSTRSALQGPNPAANDRFGFSVALSPDGSTAVVGAWGKTLNANSSAGQAYVFKAVNGVWSQSASFSDPVPAALDRFGFSVALSADGGTALIGAPGTAGGGFAGSGAAYVFKVKDGAWSQTAAIPALSNGINCNFGFSVALSADGTTALIGEPGANVNGDTQAGIVYVFSSVNGAGASSPSPVATLFDSAVETSASFGYSVALTADGTTALIGAMGQAVNGKSFAGAAYVYSASHGVWGLTPVAAFNDPLARVGDNFGDSVALSSDGTTALIGAGGTTLNGISVTGQAYVFGATNGVWSTAPAATFPDPAGAANDEFGIGVALSADGTTALIGAAGMTLNGNAFAGEAYVFKSVSGTWSKTKSFLDPAAATNDEFGLSAALSGDGGTALIGAWGTALNSLVSAGQAYAFASPVDLSLALHSNPSAITAGQDTELMVTVTNSDTAVTAGDVSLTDVLPAGMAYVSSSAAGGSCSASGGTVTCTLASLAPRATWQPSITAASAAAGSFKDSASVSSNEPDPAPSNNATDTAITVNTASSPPPPSSGAPSGGGAFGLLSLGLLGVFLRYRR